MKHTRVFASMGLLAGAGAGTMVAQAAPRPPVPERPFERPGGPYLIGSIDTLWVDSTRDEIVSKDPSDKRRVMEALIAPAQPGA